MAEENNDQNPEQNQEDITRINMEKLKNAKGGKYVVHVDDLVNGTHNAKIIIKLCELIAEIKPHEKEFAFLVSSARESHNQKESVERIGYGMCGSDRDITIGIAQAMVRQPDLCKIILTAVELFRSHQKMHN